ncbi:purine-nucleoside phosphorylase [Mycoplasmatota bacterium WC44]
MSTPHNSAVKGDIAKVVLMPGDPLRAEYIANTFLEDVVQFNNVRGMKGFTGTYKGRKLSVMGSGMGIPSIGIYSYELFKFYDVESIIRIGSCGAVKEELDLYQVILTTESFSESTYPKMMSGFEGKVTKPSPELNEQIKKIANDLDINIVEGRTSSGDVFYKEDYENLLNGLLDNNVIAVEMEATALFHNANVLGKKAACILTVSDNIVTKEETTAEERQNAFTQMMKIALELAE